MKKIFAILLGLVVGAVNGAFAQQGYSVSLASGYDANGAAITLTAVNPGENEVINLLEGILVNDCPPVFSGARVTLTVTPGTGYDVLGVSAETYIDTGQLLARGNTRGNNDPQVGVEVTLTKGEGNTWTFTMPEANVELAIQYIKVLQASWISIYDLQLVASSPTAARPSCPPSPSPMARRRSPTIST